MRDLNHFYLSYASLWELDYDAEGFRWLDCHEEEKCVYAFERRSQRERLVAVFNFSDKAWVDFDLKVPGARELKPAFSSDLEPYGGSRRKQETPLAEEDYIFRIELEAYSAQYFLVK